MVHTSAHLPASGPTCKVPTCSDKAKPQHVCSLERGRWLRTPRPQPAHAQAGPCAAGHAAAPAPPACPVPVPPRQRSCAPRRPAAPHCANLPAGSPVPAGSAKIEPTPSVAPGHMSSCKLKQALRCTVALSSHSASIPPQARTHAAPDKCESGKMTHVDLMQSDSYSNLRAKGCMEGTRHASMSGIPGGSCAWR